MQNDPQNNSYPMASSNPALRYQAVQALRGHWQTALLVSFIAMLPNLIVSVVQTLNAGSVNAVLNNMLLQVYAATLQGSDVDPAALFTKLYAMIPQNTRLLNSALLFVAFLVTPMLSLGSNRFYQKLLRRDGDVTVATVFSRAGLFFKAIGLQLWTALKVAAWMLPGIGVLTATAAVAYVVPTFSQRGFSWVITMLIVGYGATFVPALLAVLRYAQASAFLADHPEAGIRKCVTASKAVMAGRKGRLAAMYCSLLIWYVTLLLLQELCYSLAGNILSVTVGLLGQLVLNVYTSCCLMAFYDAWKGKGEAVLGVAQKAEPDTEASAYDDGVHD